MANKTGIFALEDADLFNILCIPPYLATGDVDYNTVISTAAAYCEEKRAMLLVDSPSEWIELMGLHGQTEAIDDCFSVTAP